MKRLLLILLPLVLLVIAACSPALQPVVRPDNLSYPPLQFHVPEVEKMVLPNGIRLYLQEDHELDRKSVV